MDMWRFLFGSAPSVVARPAVVAICGGPAGRLTFRCVVVFGFAVPNRHFFHGSARYVVVIKGRSVVPRKIAKFGYVVPTKTVQMTWICGTLLFRCIWICGVVSICGGQPGVLDMDI